MLDSLVKIIRDRKKSDISKSYTRKLLDQGIEECIEKLQEEFDELKFALKHEKTNIVHETSDLIYHLLVSLVHKNLTRIDFLKIDTEGYEYEYEILLGLGNKISLVKILMFEHHYDNMIIKNYTFTDINNFLKMNNFNQIYKSKMPFRKTFEYIYKREELIN